LKTGDREYLLIENRKNVSVINEGAMTGTFNRGDLVLVLPTPLTATKRDEAIRIAKSVMLFQTDKLKKMGAELHVARSTSMDLAQVAVYGGRKALVLAAIMTMGVAVSLLPFVHELTPPGSKGRAILNPEATYLNYVHQTKVDLTSTPVIDKEKTKKDLETFKSWQEKEKAHD
jgi:hypothetical protein